MKKIEYRVVDHTADFAFEVEAEDLCSLIEACVLAVTDAMFGEIPEPRAESPHVFDVDAVDPVMALFQAVSELLFLLDARGMVVTSAVVRRGPGSSMVVRFGCEPLDPGRHRHVVLFKAVTLHGLDIRATDRGLVARVVMDV